MEAEDISDEDSLGDDSLDEDSLDFDPNLDDDLDDALEAAAYELMWLTHVWLQDIVPMAPCCGGVRIRTEGREDGVDVCSLCDEDIDEGVSFLTC